MLYVWRDQKGIMRYELLLAGKTINSDLYCQQLMRLKQEIEDTRSGASAVSVDSRQRPAAHASAWRNGIGRQLTKIPTYPASAKKPPATTPSRSRQTPTGTNAAVRVRARAPRPGRPANYPQLRSRIYTTAPKLMSPHSNSLKCRRLSTAAIGRAERAGTAPGFTGR
ncbi:hypothetical protein EVAR_26576_1 [Eumeta japonica]|uniref:Uncharacterized protein n=1 Tax=Eumeta variegata TaxID=151549 RepID=A0A4C1W4Z8_EUMVA|nr:hypothetical protein EVAR_26576_1 [Eumeta japonica]